MDTDIAIKEMYLPDFDFIFLNCKPKHRKKTGVYFLLNEGEIVYIGQSTDMDSRCVIHERDKIFDSTFYIECESRDMDLIESLMIHHYEPAENKNHAHHGEKCAPMRISKMKDSLNKHFAKQGVKVRLK